LTASFSPIFENRIDVDDDNDEQEWRACLNGCGIAVDVQNSIMHPFFEDLRLSESCLFWFKDTVRMRYAGLEDIQKSSRQREMQLGRIATRSGGNQGGGGHDGQQGDPNIATSRPNKKT
jgi:hypothetical protein